MTERATCWSCGGELTEAARYCSQCGARLDVRGPSGNADVDPGTSCERRQLTVMFCDLVESTKLSLALDPEDFTTAVSVYRDACVRVMRYWGGYIARYVGDGVLIFFGYPQASEDDALRAAAAAWELAHAVPNLRVPPTISSTRRAGLPHMQVRISLHTGLAVVGDVIGRYSSVSHDVLGAAPNIAAKLLVLAQPGEVVVSEVTARLLPPVIAMRQIQSGAATAQVAGLSALAITDVPLDRLRRRPVSAGSYVGRDAILEKILSQVGDGQQEMPGLLLVGEAGVGKSRLVHEVINRSGAKCYTWLEFACSAYGQFSPLHPFGDWLNAGTGADATAGAAPATPSYGEAKVDANTAPKRDVNEGLTSPFERRRQIFRDLTGAILGHAPRIGIVLEDIHWADSTTLDFIAELLAVATPARPMLLMTSRQPLQDASARWPHLQVESLERLAPGDAAMLARSLSTQNPLNAFELAEVVDRADGIPLFIEEFVKAKTDSASDDTRQEFIPTTLRDSLMAVLDSLATGRTVALCASVLGRHFNYSHLRQLLELDESELVSALQALTKAKILVQKGELPNASFEFRHVLLRDTAYQTLLKSERERWHRRVGKLAAAGHLALEDTAPELLAIHHSLGGSYTEAINYWLKAESQSMQRSANAEALTHIKKGLEDCMNLAQEDATGSAHLELELLRRLPASLVAVMGWSSPELERVYARSRELCQIVEAPDAEFDLMRSSCNFHLLRSEVKTAEVIADRLVAMAQAIADHDKQRAHQIEALRTKALTAFYAARYPEARSLLEQTLSIYDASKHASHAFRYGTEPATFALCYLGWMDSIAGQTAKGRERVTEALKRARVLGHAFSTCYALCFGASCAQLSGDVEQAAADAEEALRVANKHNFQYWLAWARAVHGWVKGLEAPQEGLALIEQARVAYLATGSSLVAPYFEALACSIARSAGLDDFAAREAALEARAKTTGVWFWEAALNKSSVADPRAA